ncbi:hypothetical protein LAZ67_18001614 [Cordylochernes scorpioides]|uniref:Uncharacterized protein n=1 Tax=Cordylochernes scorpioides TaxID=51811 RepID=A0ABY6LG90_9ARAC|nr:hypothetical protein LAZ67_18001614 [Cordylochernes scorpioides]
MVFRNGGKPSREDRWYWNGKPLMLTRRYNYLGYPLKSSFEPLHWIQGIIGHPIYPTHVPSLSIEDWFQAAQYIRASNVPISPNLPSESPSSQPRLKRRKLRCQIGYPRNYEVITEDGTTAKRHHDQLMRTLSKGEVEETVEGFDQEKEDDPEKGKEETIPTGRPVRSRRPPERLIC